MIRLSVLRQVRASIARVAHGADALLCVLRDLASTMAISTDSGGTTADHHAAKRAKLSLKDEVTQRIDALSFCQVLLETPCDDAA
jgi:uncharacterized protein YdcH (DUF465 family)